ncbi:hypothetical protein FF124_17020 [Martelella lutilitoris]|uniref:Uncharacterized protein n=1 Tax=Martelella lutilitoris TaxID=2583532 RepID=A0A5C4JPW7_9HYPH|nr:hypothetical protein [Martelella lutilitoris]TNB46689.1 hypothetical protein FF124_17020 [Martelella lutilitoris]
MVWGWINANSGALSAIASICTIVIWAIYLQLIFSGFREGRRAKILINRGAGPTLDGHCLVANMSAKPIYVDAVLLDFSLKDDEGNRDFRYSLSNLNFDENDSRDQRERWFQGPLDSGEHIDLGSFKTLIGKMSPKGFDDFENIADVKLTVVATYTSEDQPVAAERSFDIIRTDGDLLLSPRSYSANQIRSRSARKRIENEMRDLHNSERGDDRETGDGVQRLD